MRNANVEPLRIEKKDGKVRTQYNQRAAGFDRRVVRTLTPAAAFAEGLRLIAVAQEIADETGARLHET